MRIALFLKYDNFAILDKNVIQAYTFDVEKNLITSIGNEVLTLQNTDYLLLWLLSKQIQIIYANDIDENIKQSIRKTGIEIKPIDDIKDNPLLNRFLI